MTLTLASANRARNSRASWGLTLLAVPVFLVMSGFNTDFAGQQFDITLSAAIDTIEAGSVPRRLALGVLAITAAISLLLVSRQRASTPRAWAPSLPALALAGFVALALASPLWAVDSELTLRRAGVLVLLIVGAIGFAREMGVRGLTKLTLVISSIVVLIAVVTQVLLGSFSPLDGDWRLAGVLHPVNLSWYCGLGVLAAIALGLQMPRRRPVLLVAAVIFGIALFLTRTRTGVASTAAGCITLFLLSDPIKLRQRLAKASLAAGVLLLGLVILVSIRPPGTSDYGPATEAVTLGRRDAINQTDTFTGRLPIWVASVQLVQKRPLLGYGYNAFSSPEMLEEFAQISGWVPTSIHSGYVEALLDLGSIGLLFLLAAIAAGTSSTFRLAHRHSEYSFAAAALLWLSINLFLESAVLFDGLFVSFLAFALLIEAGLFAPGRSH